MADETLEILATQSESPEKFQTIVRLIYQHVKGHPQPRATADSLVRMASASPYGLSQWMDALCEFKVWLDEQSRPADFAAMLGYLECTAASSEATAGGRSFVQVLDSMLREFGVE